MTPGPRPFASMQCEMPCVDVSRLATTLETISLKLKARGVDFDKPCGRSADNASCCWTTSHLQAMNEAMRVASMHIFEHAPGMLTLSSVQGVYPECQKIESTLFESAAIVYTLLKEHRCLTRLYLGDTAALFFYYPMMLSKALQENKWLQEVQANLCERNTVRDRTHAFEALSSALAKLSARLDVLAINRLVPAVESGVIQAARRGTLRHLIVSNGVSGKVGRRLYRAVGCSSSLRVLEIGRDLKMPPFDAAMLSDALRRNETLRKLTVEWVVTKDALGTLLESLKDNASLEELSLSCFYEPGHKLSEGLMALHSNRVLKCLKLVEVGLDDESALIIADVLRKNGVLQDVCLATNGITDRGALALAMALRENSTLKRLDISECTFSHKALSAFIESLSSNTIVEHVQLGAVNVPKAWTPSSLLTADICARLDVTWNTRCLEDWAASLRQGRHHFPRLSIGWTSRARSSAVESWFDAAQSSGVSITELVINPGGRAARHWSDATVSFLETTSSLKKLTLDTDGFSCSFVTAVIQGLARNTTVSEAEFHLCLHKSHDVKALRKLMRTNRTLHRLAFNDHNLRDRDVQSLASALEDNFVLVSFDTDNSTGISMYPIVSILNRNKYLLNRAVEHVLKSSMEEESIQALRLLSTTDSLLNAVAEVSGKGHEECRVLVQESVSHL